MMVEQESWKDPGNRSRFLKTVIETSRKSVRKSPSNPGNRSGKLGSNPMMGVWIRNYRYSG